MRGAALLLALWAMLVLSASVLVWASYIRQTILIAGEQQNDTQARAMAHSGGVFALHPLVSKETPALQMMAGSDPGYTVRMVSEGAKLNVNTLFGGEDPRRLEIFRRWLESRGLDPYQQQRFMDCILDWLDPDNLKRTNGEEDGEGYHPRNRGQFLDVDELAEVAGSDPLLQSPGWKDDLTVYSQGGIDVTSADKNILRLLPGTNDPGIDRFLQWRRGGDQIDGTLDDPPIQRLDQVQAFLGMNKAQWNALGGLVSLRDNTWRIQSKGWAGKVVRQVEIVARKGGQNPMIILWKE